MKMKKIILLIVLILSCASYGSITKAQSYSAIVVPACGTPPTTYVAGYPYSLTQDTTGTLCTPSGGGGGSGAPYVFTSTGFQQVGSFSTSTGFTPPATSTVCYIQAEGNSVRFRTDGVAPTALVGQLLQTGQLLTETANLAGIRFIPTTGSATLDVDCYR